MLRSVKEDLEVVCDGLEHLKGSMERLTLAERVDVAARLSAARKSIEQLDELIKDDIKSKLKHRAGTVIGEIFKAVLSLVPTTRLDQKALKENDPSTYEAYCRRSDVERVNFEPRG